ncbi:hypothetical protein [Pelosinus propionicus]|uniref:Uncharacterized protein n=1 Tax=Pelosinus propionicus DSM 13327 TaxID=1123291 RepID=A0A1I4QI18_9FIRM|nr:hypothetical protein [Pelosinus propionicus]SFM39416.1 hypothetical protein SAMN04490355_11014 [Pelosinus propionicus DSM 13327]
MEEILRQLLEGQKQLFEGQNRVESRLEGMEGRLNGIEGRLSSMEGRLEGVGSRLENLEGQVEENSGFIQALVHQSEYQKVQMDQLVHATARIEGEVKSIRTDLGAVEAITAKNWNDIIQLKVAR